MVVTGPSGCGKTRNSKTLMNMFKMKKVVDGWDFSEKLVKNAVHLTNDSEPDGWNKCKVVKYSNINIMETK